MLLWFVAKCFSLFVVEEFWRRGGEGGGKEFGYEGMRGFIPAFFYNRI